MRHLASGGARSRRSGGSRGAKRNHRPREHGHMGTWAHGMEEAARAQKKSESERARASMWERECWKESVLDKESERASERARETLCV
eukprot:5948857-Pleurochrysis_carterae.AAC.1